MQSFEQFHIDTATFATDTGIATFHYNFDNSVSFTETIVFPKGWRQDLDTVYLDTLLFHCSLAIGVSYYKLYPTATIVVESGSLDHTQQQFWHDFYIQGLGEFFYTNNLDPHGLANFTSSSTTSHQKQDIELTGNYLVPIGGGKDSIVSIELLQRHIPKEKLRLYTHGKIYPVHEFTVKQSGCEHLYTARTIDQQLFEMNTAGYYNGHVPITGIISFITLLVSYLYDFSTIVMSNEGSANFGNTSWKGYEINHQRSKSKLFETSFRKYVETYINSHLTYVSLLRPWYEFRISQEFSNLEKYFSGFSSCNTNFKIVGENSNVRCGKCPKCLFVYAILRPFITKEAVLQIRGEDYYNDENHLPLFQELRGVNGIKPFECVGTYDEMQYATWLHIQQQKNNSSELSSVLLRFEIHISSTKTIEERERLGEELLITSQDDLADLPASFQVILTA